MIKITRFFPIEMKEIRQESTRKADCETSSLDSVLVELGTLVENNIIESNTFSPTKQTLKTRWKTLLRGY